MREVLDMRTGTQETPMTCLLNGQASSDSWKF
jgi:hypothetical protein